MCCEGNVDRVKKAGTSTPHTRFWKVMENTPQKVMENHLRYTNPVLMMVE